MQIIINLNADHKNNNSLYEWIGNCGGLLAALYFISKYQQIIKITIFQIDGILVQRTNQMPVMQIIIEFSHQYVTSWLILHRFIIVFDLRALSFQE